MCLLDVNATPPKLRPGATRVCWVAPSNWTDVGRRFVLLALNLTHPNAWSEARFAQRIKKVLRCTTPPGRPARVRCGGAADVAHHHLASRSIRLRIAGGPLQNPIETLLSAEKTNGCLQRAVGEFQLWGCRSTAWLAAGCLCLSRPSTGRPFPSVTLASSAANQTGLVSLVHRVLATTSGSQWIEPPPRSLRQSRTRVGLYTYGRYALAPMTSLAPEPSYSGRVLLEPNYQ